MAAVVIIRRSTEQEPLRKLYHSNQFKDHIHVPTGIVKRLRQDWNLVQLFSKATLQLDLLLDQCLVIFQKEQYWTGRQRSVVQRWGTDTLHRCIRSNSFRMVHLQQCCNRNIRKQEHYNCNGGLNDRGKGAISRRLQHFHESRWWWIFFRHFECERPGFWGILNKHRNKERHCSIFVRFSQSTFWNKDDLHQKRTCAPTQLLKTQADWTFPVPRDELGSIPCRDMETPALKLFLPLSQLVVRSLRWYFSENNTLSTRTGTTMTMTKLNSREIPNSTIAAFPRTIRDLFREKMKVWFFRSPT